MIKVKIICDACKVESVEFSVRNENDVFANINKSKFRFVKYDDRPEKLLGPLCYEQYQAKLVEAEAAKDKVITDWYTQERIG